MKRSWMIVGVALLVVGLVASTALVQEGKARAGRRGGRRGGRGGSMMMSRGGGGALPDHTASIRDLTAEQRTQIREVRRATMKKVRKLEKEMNDEIKKLLTAEQVQAMETAQKRVTHRGPGGVIMTDEQKAIWDEARATAGKAEGREERARIMQEASETIRASYTDEQKKQAEAQRARWGGRGSRKGRRKGGGDE